MEPKTYLLIECNSSFSSVLCFGRHFVD